jgi:Cft2 family RNA processing exonuclease
MDPFAWQNLSQLEDETEVPVDVVMEYMCSGGTVVPEGFAVGTDRALRVKNDLEEYEWEPEEILEQPEQIEYGQGKRRAIANTQYQKDFWRH